MLPRRIRLLTRDRAGPHHGVEHQRRALPRFLEMAGGCKRRRRAHQAREHRRLAQRQLFRGLAEVALGRGVHAVDAGAEIGGVEIA